MCSFPLSLTLSPLTGLYLFVYQLSLRPICFYSISSISLSYIAYFPYNLPSSNSLLMLYLLLPSFLPITFLPTQVFPVISYFSILPSQTSVFFLSCSSLLLFSVVPGQRANVFLQPVIQLKPRQQHRLQRSVQQQMSDLCASIPAAIMKIISVFYGSNDRLPSAAETCTAGKRRSLVT